VNDTADVSYSKAFPVSWEELHRTAKALAWRLFEMRPFEGVIAITRGGLVPAAIVARELEIHVVDTISAVSYHDNAVDKIEERERGEVRILKPPSMTEDGEGWLIVDDLVDTGETLKKVRSLFTKAHFATVYAKPAGRPLVDTFVTEVSQDTWIYFPWDLEPRPVEPIVIIKR
jgi:xanthine phosphoribosyltransferase